MRPRGDGRQATGAQRASRGGLRPRQGRASARLGPAGDDAARRRGRRAPNSSRRWGAWRTSVSSHLRSAVCWSSCGRTRRASSPTPTRPASSASHGATGRKPAASRGDLRAELLRVVIDRPGGLDRGSGRVGVLAVPSAPRAKPRAPAALHRLLRAGRRAVRHPSRRLRGGHDDGRGHCRLRPPQGRARCR